MSPNSTGGLSPFGHSVGSKRYPSRLEKNHVLPPSSQDEALSRYSISGESPVRNWRSKGHLAPLMRPKKFPDIPVSLKWNTEVPGTFFEPVLPS